MRKSQFGALIKPDLIINTYINCKLYRASAVDVLGGSNNTGAGSRRSSYRTDDPTTDPTTQISGLSVDEDRPLRRRGSQL